MENIKIEEKENIALITIDHPPANAWDLKTLTEFGEALSGIEASETVRTVMITGAGKKCFSAGFDVRDASNIHKISPLGRSLWRRIDRFPKPVIAVINGFALGGGLELAMSCHFRFMTNDPKATVGLTELNLGIIPGWGGTQRLPRLVGLARALNMILFSERISGAEALAIGLVDRVSAPEKLMEEAFSYACQLAERPPIAVACVLKAIFAGLYEGLDNGLKVEAECSAIVRGTKDRQEGFAAFLEKRKPRFIGR